MISDLHCHILPGVDDGPPTMDESLRLALGQVRDGVRRVVATPHHGQRMRVEAEVMQAGVAALNAELARHEIPLEVLPGAEVAMARLPDLDAGDLGALALGGGRWILLEAPTAGQFPVEAAVRQVQSMGFEVLLAHPERCAVFSRDFSLLEACIRAGARASLTASSLTGAFGRPTRRIALQMVEAGLIHNVASDAHDAVRRAPDLCASTRDAGYSSKRRHEWYEAFPALVLGGGAEAPPAAPVVAPREAPAPAAERPAAPPPPRPEIPTYEQIAATMAAKGFAPERIERAIAAFVPVPVARRIARRAILAAGRGGAEVSPPTPPADNSNG
ncbi:tyrosine-protein phosphatase [Conexibacter woesei]|uniref:tyrosine-protein phosphatase n=1 Tax=Conexibacter woesei TaxID=191495 RepID=UPI000416D1BB|nr:CpsB/CapC family capsule biosynthesis tyrosine phosphatase [Conexibacter woesei]